GGVANFSVKAGTGPGRAVGDPRGQPGVRPARYLYCDARRHPRHAGRIARTQARYRENRRISAVIWSGRRVVGRTGDKMNKSWIAAAVSLWVPFAGAAYKCVDAKGV